MLLEVVRLHRRCLLCLDQRFLQTTRRRITKYARQHVDRRKIGMRSRWDMVKRHHQLRTAGATNRRHTLAILGRLDGVRLIHHAAGAWNDAELFLNERKCALLVEVAGNHQHRVVRLIVLMIEGLQLLDRHILDVALRADGKVTVRVEQIRRA